MLKRGLSLSCLNKLAILSLCAALFAGCSNQKVAGTGAEAGKSAEKHEPVTITVGVKGSGYLNDEEMQRYMIDPVKKKYPWITVEKVLYASEGSKLPELVASGQVPDIIMTNDINGFPELDELGLLTPLDELIKKNQMDLGRFEPETLDAVKINSGRSELVAIPFTRHIQALYYNKDIFDKFGVPYPKDGMTWDDAIDLAKRVTRKVDGVQYSGLQENVIQRPASQLSLPYVDPKTNKAIFNTDAWKHVLSKMAEIHQIPGNEEIVGKNKANIKFTKDQNLAMLAANNIFYSAGLDKLPDFNWDLTSMPVWPEAPGKEPRIDETILVLSKTSTHQDDAYRVISSVVSDEVQMDMAKQGRLSVMKEDQFKKAFGQELSFIKGKNVQAVYKTTGAKSFVPTLYDTIAMDALDNALAAVVKNEKDLNTALRDAEESVNKQIEEKEKGK